LSKQAFEKKIEALEALRSAADSAAVPVELRKALRDRNNYLVSKAAELVADLKQDDLIPELIAAFDRFMIDPVKSDPQCWAKNAIAKALKNLGHRDAHVFLRGIVHAQPEPVWGGQADSASTLRGTCALALVDCRLDDLEILTHLTDRLADEQMPVRVDAALAIGQFARPEGVLPLRLKAWLGHDEPEVIGQCFTSLMALDSRAALGFIAGFLGAKNDDVRAEAAGVLAQAREPEALQLVIEFYKRKRLPAEFRVGILMALGASPLREAADFLMSVVRSESGELAGSALTALGLSRFRNEMREAARAVVAQKEDPGLNKIFEREFGVPLGH
jgi:HEAT repeat protein